MATGLTLLAAGAAFAAALPALRETRRTAVTDLRAQAPGHFAALSQGQTHYQWHGSQGAPVTICIHGLTTPSFVWQGLTPHLTASGARVLTYDLYGRGYSDAPRGPQTAAFFAQQLTDLLDHQDIHGPVTLIGYSMGGAIAASFAAHHPDRVRRLNLIAPAGMGHDLGPLARMVRTVPVLGDWAFHMGYPRSLRAGIAAERALPCSVPDMARQQSAQLDRRGFLRSVLSSLRGQLRHPLETDHRKIAASGLPVTAIWGRDDSVIPIRAMETLSAWNANARQTGIKNAGHGLPYTHTAELAQALAA